VELKATRYAVADRVATITLDRPHRLNAWTGRMHAEYRWSLAQADQDPHVRAIVVTGAGRAFCAGADSAALDGHVAKGGYDDGLDGAVAQPGYGVRPEFDQDFAYHFGLTKPVIAAVNGPAAGVGFVLMCFADLRFAAEGAKLTTAHGRLHLPAEYGLSWLLPRIVGLSHAMDLLLSSRVVLADEAARMGLVNQVHPPDRVVEEAMAYARRLADTVSPGSLHETRRQVYTDLHRDVGSAVVEARALLERMMTEPEFAEGVRALQEKRPPQF
jgi:enoyl-CoA hydratase/carnithine racemase